MLDCDHQRAWKDFKILGRYSSKYLFEIQESLLIKSGDLTVNKN